METVRSRDCAIQRLCNLEAGRSQAATDENVESDWILIEYRPYCFFLYCHAD